MRSASKRSPRKAPLSPAQSALFWASVSAFVMVPLIFTTSVYRVYSFPKYAVLLVVSSVVALLITLNLKQARDKAELPGLLKSRLVFLVCGFLLVMAVSTLLGAAPLSSLFGSTYNQMGLLTHLGYFVCFVGLIVGVATNKTLLTRAMWALCVTGFVAALYGVSQFFGFDPFLSSRYTSGSGHVRSLSTLGHSNYLGNFLLYITPLSLGLALTLRGRTRLLALTGAGLCLLGIVFTGTRGAWLGIVAGMGVFVFSERTGLLSAITGATKGQVMRRAVIALLTVGLVGLVISMSQASHSIVARAKSFATEGFTGAGRTILWRDSLKMLPAVALLGTGPEGFRKAFLAYKSKDLARLAPTTNNENPHNSYLDALISYGLPGAALYFAMIASAFSLFVKARRDTDRRMSLVITGLLSSFVAVLVHNFFIYNQIATGLYFFGFLALAQVLTNIGPADRGAPTIPPERAASRGTRSKGGSSASLLSPWVANAGIGAASVLVLASIWYAAGLFEAEAAVREIIVAARAGNFNQVVKHCGRTADSPDPTGAHEFLAMDLLAQMVPSLKPKSIASAEGLETVYDKSLDLAISLSPRPLAHTLTPELVYVMLGYMALRARDHDRLREYASGALRWDPNSYQGHYLLSKVYLAQGENKEALAEADLALEIKPSSSEVMSVRDTARGRPPLPVPTIEKLIKRSEALAKAGDTWRARKKLLRAIKRADSPCALCHRELALVYEKENLRAEAIDEWRKYLETDPSAEDIEQVRARIAALEQNSPTANQPAR